MQPPGSSTGSSYNRNYSPSRSVTTAAGSSSSLFPSASSTNNAGTPATLSAAAALQGATHAFHRQRTGGGGGTIGGGGRTERDGNLKVNHGNGRVNPNQTGTGKGMGTGTGKEISHGALLAATQAVSAVTTSTSASRSRPQSALGSRPGSVGGMHGGEPDGLVAQRMAQYLHASGSAANAGAKAFLSPPQSLLPVSPAQGADGRGSMEPLNGGPMQTSASFIAATLAASRSASPTPSSSVAQQSASSTGRGAANSSPSMNAAGASTCSSLDLGTARLYVNVPDTASIWPTTSLVSLFEGKRDVDPVKGAAGQARPRTPEMERERTTQGEQQQKLRVKPKPKPKPKSKGLVGPSSTTNTGKQNETWTEVSGDRMGGAGPALRAPTHVDNQHSQRAPARVAERSSETTQPSLAKPSSKTISPVATEPTKIARPERAHPSLEASGVADMTMPIVNTAAAQHDITPVGTQERTQTPRRLSQSSASSDDTFVSASSVQSGRPVQSGTESDQRTPRATEQRRQSSPHAILLPATHRPTMSRASTPNLPLDSLTDAIVASNLASTRQTTTSSASFQAPPPIPAPRRHGGKNSHRGKHTSGSRSALPTIPLQPNRTAESLRSQLTDGSRSPNRAQHPQATQHQQQRTGVLLQTLRATQPVHSDDEDARRRASQHHHHRRRRKVKASLGGGRKHAHHEGARRRWRDEVTPRERRRYEAVWASNKGLFLKPGWGYTSDHTGEDDGRAWDGPEAELVVNIVVRDIWRRSRLPADELAEVWDLVYCHHQRRRHAGGGGGDGGDLLAGKERERKALTRDEFVVGMWLIDQRLRGRKIPARVGQSVWESVR